MAINGVVTYGPTIINVGDWIAFILYFTWGVNAVIAVIIIYFVIRQNLKDWYKKGAKCCCCYLNSKRRKAIMKEKTLKKSKQQGSGGMSLFNSNQLTVQSQKK